MELGLTAGGGFLQACVFASCSQIPSVKRRQAIAGLRTSSLARPPTTDLSRAPTSWGLAVRHFSLKAKIDHPAVRTPGVILEAVTTSVSRIPASYPIPPFVILHIALASCFRHSISYLMRIELPPMYHRIVQARTMFFFVVFTLEYCSVLL